LDAAGFSGIAYRSAEDLMADGRASDALCIVTDVKLPVASGFELVARLRAGSIDTPVILISARDARALRNKARSLGAAAYLAKPFPGHQLIAAIERTAKSTRSRSTEQTPARPSTKR
jgi:FixJ family two-component response regulator